MNFRKEYIWQMQFDTFASSWSSDHCMVVFLMMVWHVSVFFAMKLRQDIAVLPYSIADNMGR